MDLSDPIESNSYAISYRLLGSRPAALAAAHIAAERVRQRFDEEGGLDVVQIDAKNWLPMLVDFTVEASVKPEMYGDGDVASIDSAGLREALRRRLVRANRMERVIGALVHLGGYGIDDVAAMLVMDPRRVEVASHVLSPPPGIDYRSLGDPRLVGAAPVAPQRRSIRPRRSTVIVATVLAILIVLAVQCQGPRPSLVDNGAAANTFSVPRTIN